MPNETIIGKLTSSGVDYMRDEISLMCALCDLENDIVKVTG